MTKKGPTVNRFQVWRCNLVATRALTFESPLFFVFRKFSAFRARRRRAPRAPPLLPLAFSRNLAGSGESVMSVRKRRGEHRTKQCPTQYIHTNKATCNKRATSIATRSPQNGRRGRRGGGRWRNGREGAGRAAHTRHLKQYAGAAYEGRPLRRRPGTGRQRF